MNSRFAELVWTIFFALQEQHPIRTEECCNMQVSLSQFFFFRTFEPVLRRVLVEGKHREDASGEGALVFSEVA